MLDILAYLPFNLKLDVMVQVFNKGSFVKIILGKLKRGVGSNRINYPIIGKLNMRYQVFPHPCVPGNKAPQHLTQGPIKHFCLTIILGMTSSRKQEFSSKFSPPCPPKVT